MSYFSYDNSTTQYNGYDIGYWFSGTLVEVPTAVVSTQVYVPTVQAGATIAVPTAVVSTQVYTPTVQAGATISVPLAVVYTQAYVPTVQAGATISVPLAVVYTQAYVPTVQAGATISVPTATVSTQTYVPTVQAGATIAVPTATVSTQTYVPTVQAGATISVPLAVVYTQAYVPTVQAGATIAVPTAVVSTQAYTPTVHGGGDICTEYLNILTSQYRTKPNINAFAKAIITPICDAIRAHIQLEGAFDIDTTTGVQLDTLGEYIGVSRALNYQPPVGYSATLGDDDYRLVLRAKIARNQWDGTINKAYELFKNIFSDVNILIIDNQDMTFDVVIGGMTNDLQKSLVENGYIIPKPIGVKYNVLYSDSVIFAYDLLNATFAGYDIGNYV